MSVIMNKYITNSDVCDQESEINLRHPNFFMEAFQRGRWCQCIVSDPLLFLTYQSYRFYEDTGNVYLTKIICGRVFI